MADQLDRFTRRTKKFYEEIVTTLMPGRQGLDTFLFPVVDMDANSANFAIDELVDQPHGVSFRTRGAQSAVRPYVAGLGNIYEVPRASEKTPVDETLRDSVITGGESTEAFSSRWARLLSNITRQHTVAHLTTRWNLALKTIRTGKFSPTGLKGEEIGLEIDFNRDSSLDVTYDFTAVGATVVIAMQEMYEAYRALNGATDNVVVIVGESWLEKLEANATIQKYFEANPVNQLLKQDMMPQELFNTQGLKVVMQFRLPKKSVMLTICTYNPRGLFKSYSEAVAEKYMPDVEAVMFSLDDSTSRYTVTRGVDAYNDAKKIIRVAGDIVFDSFTTNDPIESLFRSQARYAFVPASVNHTARSIGTFV